MAEKKFVDELYFNGGLDLDSDQKYIQKGDYRLLVNGIKVGDESYGVVEPMKGTSEVDLSSLSGISAYTQIRLAGFAYDYENNGVVLLVSTYDTSWHKHIVRYKEDGSLEAILVDNSYVNFDTSASVEIMSGFLVWTERGKATQIINMDKAQGGSIDYDSDAKLSLIKAPPLYTIDFQYGYDSDFHGSNVFKKMFQFRQQYVYEGDLKSAFGNTSDVAFNGDVFSVEDNVVQEENTKNFIDIKFDSGDATVDKIIIAAREGNDRDWYEIAVIEKDSPQNVVAAADVGYGAASFVSSISDETEYYYRFFNTGGYRFIPDREIRKSAEFIPINSDNLQAIGNNRLVFAQNVVDYADIDLGGLAVSPSYDALPASADVLPTLKRGRYYQVAPRIMDRYGRGTEPQISENLKVYIEDCYDTASKGVAKLTASNIDTVSFPSWAKYYQFLIAGSYAPFIQIPVLYAMKYTDLEGEQDGTIALLLGFDVDALNDIVDSEISSLESELSDVKSKIAKWEDYGKDYGIEKVGDFFEDIWSPGKDQREQNRKQDKLSRWRTRKEEIENEIELKKRELGNSYKKALANLKQYDVGKNDRMRILKKDFTTNTYVDQVLDMQVLDVVNDNSRYDPSIGSYDSLGGLWIKVNPPGVDGFTLEDVSTIGGETWTQQTSAAAFSDRRYHGSVIDSQGNLYVIGGKDDSNSFNDVYKSTDGGATWSQVLSDGNTQLQQKSMFGITIDSNDVIYIYGGELNDGNVVSACHYSDPGDASVWTEASTGNHERKHTALVVNSKGRLFSIGGNAGSSPENEVYYSDDKGATWTQATNSPGWSYRSRHACVVDSQDNIYLLGGYDVNYNELNDVWVCSDGVGEEWSLVTASPGWSARKEHACVVDHFDRIYVIGGSSGSGHLGDIWYSEDGGLQWTEITTTQSPSEDAIQGHVDPKAVNIDGGGKIYLCGGGINYANEVWSSDEYASTNQWQDALVEIYRPSYSDSDNTFYEISGVYDVTDTSDKTLEPSNAYLKKRSLYSGNTYKQKGPKVETWVEDAHLTHDFKSDNYNYGRPFVKTDIQKNIEHPSLIYTDPHFEGTEINGLSRADYDNVFYLSGENGKIYGLHRVGNALKAIQAHKITSFYQTQRNPLGNERQFQADFGSVHPKSMVKSSKGYLYAYDLYNGIVWRDSGNGVFNISGKGVVGGSGFDYKMDSFFKDVSSQLRSIGSQEGSNDVVASYDSENGMVYFSFVNDGLSLDYNTIIFHEDSNRWVGFVDISPEGFAFGQNLLLSVTDSSLYVHNSDMADRLNLHGSAKDWVVKLVSNNAPNIKKTFDAIAQHSSVVFGIDPITVPKEGSNVREMTSRLKSGKFEKREGIYYAPTLKNMKTTSDSESKIELVTGEDLRGYTMELTMSTSDSGDNELFKVDVYQTQSL